MSAQFTADASSRQMHFYVQTNKKSALEKADQHFVAILYALIGRWQAFWHRNGTNAFALCSQPVMHLFFSPLVDQFIEKGVSPTVFRRISRHNHTCKQEPAFRPDVNIATLLTHRLSLSQLNQALLDQPLPCARLPFVNVL